MDAILTRSWLFSRRAQWKKCRCFFINEYGARVRLGSLFTNCPVSVQNHALFPFVKIVLYVPALVQVVQYPVKNGTLVLQEKKFSPLRHAVNI